VASTTVPDELFRKIGKQIRAQSPVAHTLVFAYANGYVGYLPTRTAYSEDGHEVTHAARWTLRDQR